MKNFLRRQARYGLRMLEDHFCLICHDPLEEGLFRQFLLRGERVHMKHSGSPRNFGEELGEFLCTRCASALPYCFDPWERIPGSRLPYVPVLRYEGGVREALLRLKFGGETVLADLFALLALFRLRGLGFRPSLILPIPLGEKREKMRGYNQAGLIARELSRCMRVPLAENWLSRAEETLPQTEMQSRAERMANVNGAFCLKESPTKPAARYGELLLVDDVSTSGATLRAAAFPLLRAGFRVRSLSIAREETERVGDAIHKQRQMRYDQGTWNA